MYEPSEDRQGWQVHSQVRSSWRLQLPLDPCRVSHRPCRHVRRLLHCGTHIHEAALQKVSVRMLSVEHQ